MFSSRGTVRYEERGQGYRDVEKVGKHWYKQSSGYITVCAIHTVIYPMDFSITLANYPFLRFIFCNKNNNTLIYVPCIFVYQYID